MSFDRSLRIRCIRVIYCELLESGHERQPIVAKTITCYTFVYCREL